LIPDGILRRLTQIPGTRSLWSRFPIGPLDLRVRYGISSRPHYTYGVYHAAQLAAKLGIKAISVVEFGVAGGRGLLALENIATEVSRALDVKIAVYGFDSGEGMPAPVDYRDLPHVWGPGFYKMDQTALKATLKHANLVLGDVASTVPAFLKTPNLAPVGFVAFDLDYYSSTKVALKLLDGGPELHLPRTYCYFDDVLWPETSCQNEFVGVLCAIREFNLEHDLLKIAPINMLSYMLPHPAAWNEQMYVLHDFGDPLYSVNITPRDAVHTQMPL
jgi:hypothetical protein